MIVLLETSRRCCTIHPCLWMLLQRIGLLTLLVLDQTMIQCVFSTLARPLSNKQTLADCFLTSLTFHCFCILTAFLPELNTNNKRDLYCAVTCQRKLKGAGHCTSAKHMTSILRHVAEAFPPARQGTILNNHRVIGIATNTSIVLNYALVTYIMMTADVGLPDAV